MYAWLAIKRGGDAKRSHMCRRIAWSTKTVHDTSAPAMREASVPVGAQKARETVEKQKAMSIFKQE
jgi:hypothetical protein